jgi:nicotinamide riboside kinase
MGFMFKRINLFGGPCTRKSTLAARIFYDLKSINKNVELVQEHVKTWAYENREISAFDQLFLFSHQLRSEELALRNKVDFVVTDSPILLAICYSKKRGLRSWRSLQEIADDFETDYPSLNIVLSRSTSKYETFGRYESLIEAIEMDKQIRDYLNENNAKFIEFDLKEHDKVLGFIKNEVTR